MRVVCDRSEPRQGLGERARVRSGLDEPSIGESDDSSGRIDFGALVSTIYASPPEAAPRSAAEDPTTVSRTDAGGGPPPVARRVSPAWLDAKHRTFAWGAAAGGCIAAAIAITPWVAARVSVPPPSDTVARPPASEARGSVHRTTLDTTAARTTLDTTAATNAAARLTLSEEALERAAEIAEASRELDEAPAGAATVVGAARPAVTADATRAIIAGPGPGSAGSASPTARGEESRSRREAARAVAAADQPRAAAARVEQEPSAATVQREPAVSRATVARIADAPAGERSAPPPETPSTARRRASREAELSSELDALLEQALTIAPASAGPAPAAARAAAPSRAAVPSRDDVERAIAPVREELRSCAQAHGVAMVRMTVAGSSGRVTSVVVDGPLAGTPTGSCVARTVAGVRFEPFERATFTVQYPFRI